MSQSPTEVQAAPEPENKVVSRKSNQHTTPPRRKLVLGAAIAIAVVFAAIWGVRSWRWGQSHVSTDDAYVTSDVIQVTPRVNGYLARILVNDNEPVKAGQLLAQLDDATFRSDIEQDKANLAVALATASGAEESVKLAMATGNAQILQAQGGVGQANGSIGAAVGDVQRAQGGVANARATTQIARDNVLTAGAAITAARAARDHAVSSSKAASEAILAAIAQRDQSVRGVQVASAAVTAAQASIDAAIAAKRRAISAVEAAQAQAATARAAVQAAQENVTAAEATAEKAEKDEARERQLFSGGAVSAQELDVFATTTKTAHAQLGVAKQIVAQAQASLSQRLAEARSAQEAVSAADAGISQARAQRVQAERQRAQVQESVKANNVGIRQARAEYAGTQDAVREAEAALRRNQTQYAGARDAVPQAGANEAQAVGQLSSAQSNVKLAQGKRVQATGQLQQAQSAPRQVAVSQANARTAKARILQAKAALDSAQIAYNRTRIIAPVSGVISRRSAQIGQQVSLGQPIMALLPSGSMWIVANLKETQIRGVRPGQEAEIEIDSMPGHSFHGHVDSISSGTGATFALLPPDNATGNFTKVVQRVPVKVVLDRNQDGIEALRSGLSANVTIDIK